MIKVSTLKLSFCLSLMVHGAVFSAICWFKNGTAINGPRGQVEQLPLLEVEFTEESATGTSSSAPNPMPMMAKEVLKTPPEVVPMESEIDQPSRELSTEAILSVVVVPAEVEEQPAEQQPMSSFVKLAKDPLVGGESETPSKSEGAMTASADYLFNPRPLYPWEARRHKKEGLVTLNVCVTVEGLPEKVLVMHTSGCGLLDDAAVTAVKQWRFIPAQSDKTAIASWAEVPIRFKLSN